MHYVDEEALEVCEFDQVEFRSDQTGPHSLLGVITKIFPRKKAVRVRYENPNWKWKPTYRSATVPIGAVVLMSRDT